MTDKTRPSSPGPQTETSGYKPPLTNGYRPPLTDGYQPSPQGGHQPSQNVAPTSPPSNPPNQGSSGKK